MIPEVARLTRSRLTLILLGTLFIGPLIAAWFLYQSGLRPGQTTNYGTLVTPTMALPAVALTDAEGQSQPELLLRRWTIVQLGSTDCDDACRTRLALTRQTRLALGAVGIAKDRLQLAYVVPDIDAARAAELALRSAHPVLHIVVDAPTGPRLQELLRDVDPLALHLIDPNGNWVLSYRDQRDDDALRRGLLKDLKKLLKLSSIG